MEALNIIPQYNSLDVLDIPITEQEIKDSIKQLKNNKSAGCDAIPAEIYKCASKELIGHLKALFDVIWESGEVPQDFCNANIVNIFKNKGSASDCGNYRGISLLAIGGKILAKIMSNRLHPHIEKILPESQTGFRTNRGTVDSIFSIRQLQEKVKEQQSKLYVAFIDLTKAFDSVNRDALWAIMKKFGVPIKFLTVCKSLHNNNKSRVSYHGSLSDPFLTNTGVRQGCVLAPLLFNIFMAALSIIVDSKLQERGLDIRYRYDGGLFNIKRLSAKTRTRFITELQYADDCALVANTLQQLQEMLNTYTWAYEALGLKLNIDKTKIMCTPPEDHNNAIKIGEELLEYVAEFNYLGSLISEKANIDSEIQHRISSASRAFWKLKDRVFYNHDLSTKTKLAVYRAIINPHHVIWERNLGAVPPTHERIKQVATETS